MLNDVKSSNKTLENISNDRGKKEKPFHITYVRIVLHITILLVLESCHDRFLESLELDENVIKQIVAVAGIQRRCLSQ